MNKRMNKWNRFLAVLLLVVMCCTLISQQTNAAEDYRTWDQADERWGSIKLGNSGDTMEKSGCLVTSVTKLIIQAGLKDSDEFNPAILVNWLNKNGGFTDGGALYWDKPAQFIDGLSYYGKKLENSTYEIAEYTDDIIKWIKEGYHIILRVKNNSHFVLVDEALTLAHGEIYIMDSQPYNQNADIRLADRYSNFNRAEAYTGGITPELKPEEEPNEYPDGWNFEEDKWYYYENNQAVTGWKLVNFKWYYFDADGIMMTGWLLDDNQWYYLDDTGAMVTGWIYKDNVWYYLNGNGAMYVGWLYKNENWYYLSGSGAMHTGWLKWNDAWYYLQEDGSMAVDTYIDDYYINEEGIWIPEE